MSKDNFKRGNDVLTEDFLSFGHFQQLVQIEFPLITFLIEPRYDHTFTV